MAGGEWSRENTLFHVERGSVTGEFIGSERYAGIYHCNERWRSRPQTPTCFISVYPVFNFSSVAVDIELSIRETAKHQPDRAVCGRVALTNRAYSLFPRALVSSRNHRKSSGQKTLFREFVFDVQRICISCLTDDRFVPVAAVSRTISRSAAGLTVEGSKEKGVSIFIHRRISDDGTFGSRYAVIREFITYC